MSKRKAGASDWRSTIFYWRGRLTLESELVTWSGAWVGSSEGHPTPEAFAASENTFSLTAAAPLLGTLAELLQRKSHKNGNQDKQEEQEEESVLDFTGKYKLDQEDGRGIQSYSDFEHKVAFGRFFQDAGFSVVAACGVTEFGRFVSHGRLTSSVGNDEGDNIVLTLARRYVSDKDLRYKWTNPTDVLQLTTEYSSNNDDVNPSKELDADKALPWRVVRGRTR